MIRSTPRLVLGLVLSLAVQACRAPALPPHVVLVADGLRSTVSSYTLEPVSGILRPVPGSPFDLGVPMVSRLVVHPSGRSGYALGMSAVVRFRVEADGRLHAEDAGIPRALRPSTIAIEPTGRFLLAPSQADGRLHAYRIDPDAGAAVDVIGGTCYIGFQVDELAVHPSGRFVYGVPSPGPAFVGCEVDVETGLAKPIDGLYAPVPFGVRAVTVHPSGELVFALGYDSGRRPWIAVYRVDASTGALQPAPRSPVGAADAMAIDPTGAFLYVSRWSAGRVWAYAIHAQGGLRAVEGSPFDVGPEVQTLAVDPSGYFLRVASAADHAISTWRIDTVTGALQQVPIDVPTPPGPTEMPLAIAFTPRPGGPAPLAQLAPGEGLIAETRSIDPTALVPESWPRTLQEAIAQLGDRDAHVRVRAALALAHRGEGEDRAAVAALERALRDPDEMVVEQALDVLAGYGALARDATWGLVELVGHPRTSLRQRAAKVLRQAEFTADLRRQIAYRPPDERARLARRLLRGLGETDADVRRIAIVALAAVPDAAPLVVPRLRAWLESRDVTRRRLAAAALAEFGSSAAEALPVLVGALWDADADVRRAAAQAIAAIRRR